MDFDGWLDSPGALRRFEAMYGAEAGRAPGRYGEMRDGFARAWGGYDFRIFSAPGRIEIGGNHTDHNAGRVLAAAINLDTVAFCRANGTRTVRLRSQGYDTDFIVDLDRLTPLESERGSAQALIRGVAAGIASSGRPIGGFDAFVTSTVPKGSGLSSSASFEVLVAAALDGLFDGGGMDPVERARIAQRAENDFFGKPCGLMDQTASSVGGLVAIDFADASRPLVRRTSCDFRAAGLRPVVVDTGGDHAGLTREYAAIRSEMEQAAGYFGQRVLRQVDPVEFHKRLPELADAVPHRAILRAMHFFAEDERVAEQVRRMEAGDIAGFLALVVASGDSSFKWLQNCYADGDSRQGIPLALAASERMLRGLGAWRVHGGGFAGTILAFVPADALAEYAARMDGLFGPGACIPLSIRGEGAGEVRMETS